MTLAADRDDRNTESDAGAQSAPASCPLQNIALVINEAAGAASATDTDKIVERVAKALPQAQLNVASVAPAELEKAMDEAFAAAPDTVVVLGGDGTARGAARRAMATQIPIAPLPGGTMNVLAKLVFGHADLGKSIDDLATCRVTGLDVGVVGGEPFFLSAAFGFAGSLAKLRETFRPPRRFRDIMSATSSTLRALGPSLRGGVKWRRAGTKWRRANTLVVALGSLDRVLEPEEQELQTHARLQAAALRLKSVWDVARFSSDAVRLRDWRELNQLMIVSSQRIELELGSRRPLAVLDGEPIRLANASEISVMEGALPVLAARPEAEAPEAQAAD